MLLDSAYYNRIKSIISRSDYEQCQKIIRKFSQKSNTYLSIIRSLPYTDLHQILSGSDRRSIIQLSMLTELSNIFHLRLDKVSTILILSNCASLLNHSYGTVYLSIPVGYCYYLGCPIIHNGPGVVHYYSDSGLLFATSDIGWVFVYKYSIYIAHDLDHISSIFQAQLNALSDSSFHCFIKDIESLSKQELAADRVKTHSVFLSILISYSLTHQSNLSDTFSYYADFLKDILRKYEHTINMNSRAGRYYKKFQSITFQRECIDFDRLTDFVELFLGFYNSVSSIAKNHLLENFTFDSASENPSSFFKSLYSSRESEEDSKNLVKSSKMLLKKRMVHAMTSLIYGYAVDRERISKS